MQNTLVSVIIPTYNRKEYLQESIESVVNQSYKNIEIIVVDDGSDINYAQEICSKYTNCIYLFKTNGGLSSARNFGIKHANGDYIALLDDDDLFLPSKIQKQVEILNTKSEIFCVHSSAGIIDDRGVVTGELIGASNEKAHKRTGLVFWNALGTWVVKSPTPMFRRDVFDKVLFDETIQVGEDLDFYWRMFYLFRVEYVNEPLALYRESTDPNRLSKMIHKYVGIEKIIFDNFKKMKFINFITLHKIAMKLSRSSLRRWNNLNRNNRKEVSNFILALNPYIYLK
jgi:glycosyltransferase involved in cell wall biosynthesis